MNTLSRVERGFVPDLKNFQRIVEWLGVSADNFLEGASADVTPQTPAIIARHLHADSRLSDEAAEQIAGLVDEMYQKLANSRPALAIRLRSAQTFTPAAGVLLAEILSEMSAVLEADENEA